MSAGVSSVRWKRKTSLSCFYRGGNRLRQALHHRRRMNLLMISLIFPLCRLHRRSGTLSRVLLLWCWDGRKITVQTCSRQRGHSCGFFSAAAAIPTHLDYSDLPTSRLPTLALRTCLVRLLIRAPTPDTCRSRQPRPDTPSIARAPRPIYLHQLGGRRVVLWSFALVRQRPLVGIVSLGGLVKQSLQDRRPGHHGLLLVARGSSTASRWSLVSRQVYTFGSREEPERWNSFVSWSSLPLKVAVQERRLTRRNTPLRGI